MLESDGAAPSSAANQTSECCTEFERCTQKPKSNNPAAYEPAVHSALAVGISVHVHAKARTIPVLGKMLMHFGQIKFKNRRMEGAEFIAMMPKKARSKQREHSLM